MHAKYIRPVSDYVITTVLHEAPGAVTSLLHRHAALPQKFLQQAGLQAELPYACQL